MSEDKFLVGMLAITVGLLVFCFFGLIMSIKTSTEFSDHCENDLGGRVVWTRGTDLCVSDDGRILDDG